MKQNKTRQQSEVQWAATTSALEYEGQCAVLPHSPLKRGGDSCQHCCLQDWEDFKSPNVFLFLCHWVPCERSGERCPIQAPLWSNAAEFLTKLEPHSCFSSVPLKGSFQKEGCRFHGYHQIKAFEKNINASPWVYCQFPCLNSKFGL